MDADSTPRGRWYRRLDKLGAEKASRPKDLRCWISGFSVAELWEQHRESREQQNSPGGRGPGATPSAGDRAVPPAPVFRLEPWRQLSRCPDNCRNAPSTWDHRPGPSVATRSRRGRRRVPPLTSLQLSRCRTSYPGGFRENPAISAGRAFQGAFSRISLKERKTFPEGDSDVLFQLRCGNNCGNHWSPQHSTKS